VTATSAAGAASRGRDRLRRLAPWVIGIVLLVVGFAIDPWAYHHVVLRNVYDFDWGRALRFFMRALELDPIEPATYLRCGIASLHAKLPDMAVQFLDKGRALDPWKMHDFDEPLAAAPRSPTMRPRKVLSFS